MTVFKGYMKILKKNIGLVIIYLVIFFSVAMALQAAASKEHLEDFEKARVDIAVADNDQSTLSHALTDYLKTIHNVSEISSDPSVMQEELFYRNAEYIVQIPKDFYKTCIVQDNPISVTKIPGSYTSFYVDQQINAWLNNVRTYIASGFSQKEAAKAALEQPSSRVSMYQDTETTSETPAYTYYFRYVPYLFLAVLCYSMGYILLAFQKEDIQKRMQASSVSIRRQHLEGLLAMFTMSRFMADRRHRCNCHVSKRSPRFRCSDLLSPEYLCDDDSLAVSVLSARTFCKKQQHAQWTFQYCFSWHVLFVRCFCTNECYG